MAKESIKISGMSCAACAARIEKGLAKQEGVKSAAVNLTTERAAVEFDSAKIKVSQLIQAVEDLGYKAQKQEEISRDTEKEQREKEIRSLRMSLIISASLTAPLLLAMFLGFFFMNNPVVEFMHNPYFHRS